MTVPASPESAACVRRCFQSCAPPLRPRRMRALRARVRAIVHESEQEGGKDSAVVVGEV